MRLPEQLVGLRMDHLPERFADRLPDEDLRLPISCRNAGEWAETLRHLIAALNRRQATISAREARSMRELLETFRPSLARSDFGVRTLEDMTRWLDELSVTPSLDEQEMIDLLRALVARLADRIPPQEIDLLIVRPDEEEPGVWFDVAYDLMRILVRERVPISGHEGTELTLILDAHDLPRDRLRHLPAV